MTRATPRAMRATVLRQRQCGFGLAEAMIAAALSLFLTLVASTMLIAANANYLNTGAASRVDDSGRFALAIIGQAVRQAGYGDSDTAAFAGLDAASIKENTSAIDEPQPAINGSDVLLVHFAGSADGAMVNCAGFEEAGPHAWSIFYVGKAADGEAELRCKYKGASNWAADAIVRGVDSFQLLYGLDTDEPQDGIPNRYLTADAINAMDAATAAAGTPKSNWRRVASVRVALLLHGEFGSRPGGPPMHYALFEGGPVVDEASLPTPLQRRARRVFTATYAVRNRQGG
ncbi:PilW family protein [Pseudoduganella sp. RAF53_2]|uniref:PilW family protein n=1 Tax=unclassified Pseudoduganella TaxID=2637179 RepID=UPI003F972022